MQGLPRSKHSSRDNSKATIKVNSDTWKAGEFNAARADSTVNVWAKLVSTNSTFPNVNVVRDDVLFGRREDADVWLRDGAVSNTHCRLTREFVEEEDGKEEEMEYEVWLEDLSTNGTFVRDQRIGRGNKVKISSGTEIVLIPPGAKRKKVSYIIYIPKQEEQQAAPEGRVAIVFTDIQSSTALWENLHGDIMNQTLKRHDRILRKLLKKYNGYEVKTEGDAFFVTFFNVLDAIKWCLAVQKGLLAAKWHPQVLQQPAACIEKKDGNVLFCGVRVRMGIHVGDPSTRRNPVTSRMDYFGPVINRCARLSDSAHGGQIVLTTEVKEAFETEMTKPDFKQRFNDPYDIVDVGSTVFKGIPEPVQVFQIFSPQLAERKFPALRTESALQHKKTATEKMLKEARDNAQAQVSVNAIREAVGVGDEEDLELLNPATCASPGCGRIETLEFPFGACARCKSVKYCGTDCQRAHWKAHKKVCKKIQREAAAAAGTEKTVELSA